MPVRHNPPGTALPDDHPLKGGCIIFGMKPPKAWLERQAAKKLAAQELTSTPEQEKSSPVKE